MVKVIGIKFRNAGKVYYFDPENLDIHEGDGVIVETARGLEFGSAVAEPKEVEESEIVAPLKKVIRIANSRDYERNKKNQEKKDRAMELCQKEIDKHGLEMKLVDVEYTFDNSKVIFYFVADGRVDFRELVKDLASVFKMRIELRQIGVRDVAKMLGGIGCCGKDLCCATWLSDFQPVSIKMAKVQNLSLNPNKISGVCGRLMCCLNYENEIYQELSKGMPNPGETVKTPDGKGVVFDTNVLGNSIKVRLIEEEATDEEEEQLSTDIYTYSKEEIKRLGKRRKHPQKEVNEEKLSKDEMEEMQKLMED